MDFNKIKHYIKTILKLILLIFCDSNGLISSKRIFGALGFLISICISLYCTLLEIEAPVISETLLTVSAAMIGLDCITDIWKNKNGRQ